MTLFADNVFSVGWPKYLALATLIFGIVILVFAVYGAVAKEKKIGYAVAGASSATVAVLSIIFIIAAIMLLSVPICRFVNGKNAKIVKTAVFVLSFIALALAVVYLVKLNIGDVIAIPYTKWTTHPLIVGRVAFFITFLTYLVNMSFLADLLTKSD